MKRYWLREALSFAHRAMLVIVVFGAILSCTSTPVRNAEREVEPVSPTRQPDASVTQITCQSIGTQVSVLSGSAERIVCEIPVVKEGAVVTKKIHVRKTKGRIAQQIPDNTIEELTKRMGKEVTPSMNTCLRGGTAVTIPNAYTVEGVGQIHGLNADGAGIVSTGVTPGLFLVDETEGQPQWKKYITVSVSEMMSPTGLLGFNEAGLAVSWHEMTASSKDCDLDFFLQQRVLREAGSLQEAWKILEKATTTKSGSLFISDANTGESATVEFSGGRQRFWMDHSRIRKPRAQTNHFFSEFKSRPDLLMFNEFLSTQARLQLALEKMDGLKPDHTYKVLDVVDLFSSHVDAYSPSVSHIRGPEGVLLPGPGQVRSFGRSLARADTFFSAAALSDPKVSEIWLSIGDRNSAPHSQWAGFKVDFKNFSLTPLGTVVTTQYEAAPGWDKSLDAYVRARQALLKGERDQAVEFLNEAIAQALEDHRAEPAYHFIKARLLVEMAVAEKDSVQKINQLSMALKEFQTVIKLRPMNGMVSDISFLKNAKEARGRYSYMEALASLYSVAASDLLKVENEAVTAEELKMLAKKAILEDTERSRRWQLAEATLNLLYKNTKHVDLKPKLQMLEMLKKPSDLAGAVWPAIDMVSVEN